VFSVSVRTQIGAVGGAEHTPTTERETGRPIVFLVTEFQRQLFEASLGSFSPSVLHGELGCGHLLLQAELMSDIQLFYCSLLVKRCEC